jgi:hypothetical protein
MKKPVAKKRYTKKERLAHVDKQLTEATSSLFYALMRVSIAGSAKDELVGALVRNISDFGFYATERSKFTAKK